jgi:hypothetical protein
MTFYKKIFNRMTLRCIGAVAFGAFLTAGLAFSLSTFANFEEPDAPVATATVLPFPDSDMKLKSVAERMLDQKIEAGKLEDIEPAAGNPSPRPARKK